ncbi:MAG: penicillin-binding protein 2 [Thermodesulfobacteriota bacterium]|nr:penicillin-binding protein 2 [Thermodesulfobacteriota bacterium]
MSGKQDRLTNYDPVKFRKKIQVIIWLVSLAFFLLIARLWYLQVVRGDDLRKRSENNRVRIQEIKPLRGLIMGTHGNILVDNQSSFDISIIPEAAKDIEAVMNKLANLCDLGEDTISCENASLNSGRPFVPVRICKNIDRDKLAIVETNSLDLPGVVVDVVPVREYIYGEMMAHILGYVGNISSSELEKDVYSGYRSNDIVGKYGIEKSLDRYLKGESGGEQVEVDVAGRRLNVLGGIKPVSGYNIVLNIDADLQKICRNAFQEKAGTAIVMDPRTGSVMAMINRPSFDPNLFNRGISGDRWKKLTTDPLCPLQNRAVSGQYPPGSTYKMVVAAAALEEGLITENTEIFCNGTYQMGNRTFRCWKKRGHGMANLHRAIVESCDVYFYHLGEMLGVDKLAEYAGKFGFGYKTGISLPGEKRGLVPTKEWKLRRYGEPWQKGETTSLAIGQGFTLVTPLQLLRAYCAIANGGILYKPRLIKRIETTDGQVVEEFPPEKERIVPVSRKNIDILRYALWGAVNEPHGTGWALKRKGRDVCGKTGTAQVIGMSQDEEKPDVEEVPYKYRDHALFVCFAPYKDPAIAILVIVEHGGHGGSVAAPIARRIVDGYFNLERKREKM